jgi:putative membrane protein
LAFALLPVLLPAAVAIMSEASFYEERAKSDTRDAVRDIEAQTSAEIVVALRRVSGSYRDADYLAGLLLALIALLVMLFADHTFPLLSFPAGMIGAFALGAFCSTGAPALRRALTSPSRRRAQVRTAAREAFVDQGISRTQGRTGILVFVSLLEREVEVVADHGVDPVLLGEDWARAVAALRASLTPSPAFDRFRTALLGLAPPLAHGMPRAADDVNELPDEVA